MMKDLYVGWGSGGKIAAKPLAVWGRSAERGRPGQKGATSAGGYVRAGDLNHATGTGGYRQAESVQFQDCRNQAEAEPDLQKPEQRQCDEVGCADGGDAVRERVPSDGSNRLTVDGERVRACAQSSHGQHLLIERRFLSADEVREAIAGTTAALPAPVF